MPEKRLTETGGEANDTGLTPLRESSEEANGDRASYRASRSRVCDIIEAPLIGGLLGGAVIGIPLAGLLQVINHNDLGGGTVLLVVGGCTAIGTAWGMFGALQR